MKTFIIRWISLTEIISILLLPTAHAEGPVPCSIKTPVHNINAAVDHGPQEPDAIAKAIRN